MLVRLGLLTLLWVASTAHAFPHIPAQALQEPGSVKDTSSDAVDQQAVWFRLPHLLKHRRDPRLLPYHDLNGGTVDDIVKHDIATIPTVNRILELVPSATPRPLPFHNSQSRSITLEEPLAPSTSYARGAVDDDTGDDDNGTPESHVHWPDYDPMATSADDNDIEIGDPMVSKAKRDLFALRAKGKTYAANSNADDKKTATLLTDQDSFDTVIGDPTVSQGPMTTEAGQQLDHEKLRREFALQQTWRRCTRFGFGNCPRTMKV